MDLIGKDVSEKILNELSPIDLVKFCSVWKEEKGTGTACFSQDFWRRRLQKDFGFLFSENNKNNGNQELWNKFPQLQPVLSYMGEIEIKQQLLSDPKNYYLSFFQILSKYTEEFYNLAKDVIFGPLWSHLNDEYKNNLFEKIYQSLHRDLEYAFGKFMASQEPMVNLAYIVSVLGISKFLFEAIDQDRRMFKIQKDFFSNVKKYLLSIFPAKKEDDALLIRKILQRKIDNLPEGKVMDISSLDAEGKNARVVNDPGERTRKILIPGTRLLTSYDPQGSRGVRNASKILNDPSIYEKYKAARENKKQ
jgi:hypothetical protein